jgi:hypothetical protein
VWAAERQGTSWRTRRVGVTPRHVVGAECLSARSALAAALAPAGWQYSPSVPWGTVEHSVSTRALHWVNLQSTQASEGLEH